MKKILIVEDVDFNMDLLVQLLEDDYELVTARDGAAGIEMAEREMPDLILMDLSLPVIDGSLQRKKERNWPRCVPIWPNYLNCKMYCVRRHWMNSSTAPHHYSWVR